MRRLENLVNLTNYLKDFSLSSTKVIFAIDADNATSKLLNESKNIILVAMPELEEVGGTDTYSNSLSTAFFVLGTLSDSDKTDELELQMFLELLSISREVANKIEEDISNCTNPLVQGLRLSRVGCIPVGSVFGGWSGWSIDVSFEC